MTPTTQLYTPAKTKHQIPEKNTLRGGVQGKFFWRIRFELWAPQVPLIIRETTGEVLGPRRPIVSELRPAQKLGVK